MINKKEIKSTSRKLLLIGIILISIISLIFLVSALTSDERQSLNDELNNLNKFINNDNLMLSIDNKMLTS
ncbi:MAG: hypothetical protein AABW67_04515 [Nanoarchaeota archaeon]